MQPIMAIWLLMTYVALKYIFFVDGGLKGIGFLFLFRMSIHNNSFLIFDLFSFFGASDADERELRAWSTMFLIWPLQIIPKHPHKPSIKSLIVQKNVFTFLFLRITVFTRKPCPISPFRQAEAIKCPPPAIPPSNYITAPRLKTEVTLNGLVSTPQQFSFSLIHPNNDFQLFLGLHPNIKTETVSNFFLKKTFLVCVSLLLSRFLFAQYKKVDFIASKKKEENHKEHQWNQSDFKYFFPN